VADESAFAWARTESMEVPMGLIALIRAAVPAATAAMSALASSALDDSADSGAL
jgi:hypothetical protein